MHPTAAMILLSGRIDGLLGERRLSRAADFMQDLTSSQRRNLFELVVDKAIKKESLSLTFI